MRKLLSRCEACQRGKCHLGVDSDLLPRRRYHYENRVPERTDCKKRISWLLRIDPNIPARTLRDISGHFRRVLKPSDSKEESDFDNTDESDSESAEYDDEVFHSAAPQANINTMRKSRPIIIPGPSSRWHSANHHERDAVSSSESAFRVGAAIMVGATFMIRGSQEAAMVFGAALMVGAGLYGWGKGQGRP